MTTNKQTKLDCRFYRKRIPEVEELVRVKVVGREELAFRVLLLEYNSIEALVPDTELRKGRIRSVNKLMKKGKEYIVLVKKIHKNTEIEAETEEEAHFIDLSLKGVPVDELGGARDRWEKSRTVHAIMRQLASQTENNTEDLYELFGWPLAKKYRHLYLAFQWIMQDLGNSRKKMAEWNVPENCIELLHKELYKRMKPMAKDVNCKIEMRCFSNYAIGGIQSALQAGLDVAETSKFPIVFRVIATPLFEVSCNTFEPEGCMDFMQELIKAMKAALEAKGGIFKVVQEPKMEEEDKGKLLLETTLREQMSLQSNDSDYDSSDQKE